MSNQKGSRRERELVNLLYKYKYAVLRAPASGSAAQRELPDVLAGNGETFYAIEAKSRDTDRFYINGLEIEALLYFAIKFGAKPRIGVRFDNHEWRFIHPNNVYVTNGGNYRIDKDHMINDGETIDDL